MPEPVPLSTVKQMLVDEAARRPLPREALLAQQHAEAFARLSPEDTQKMLGELAALGFVSVPVAIKIADLLPQYPEEVRLLFAKERLALDEAQITSILELVARYR